jgi:hypothetical protein
MDLSGTFSVRDMSGNWGPVFGWTNIQLSDFSSQVFNLGYVCTPCSGLRLDLTLNDPAALLLNGKIVYPGTTFSVILLPTNGPYLQPGVMESIYLPTSIATPEPSSLILTGTGLMGLAATIKRKLGVRRRKAE